MKKNKLISCPICCSNEGINILDLNCGNLDNSSLYQSVIINVCIECGHIYNHLSPDEIDGLTKYYNEEYGSINLSSAKSIDDNADQNLLPASKRYIQLYKLISSYLNCATKVLDIGCGMGGFLDYLYKQGLDKLYGIDLIEDYVNYAKKRGNINIKLGNAESIPFDDYSFDVVIMDQVMEHLVDPMKAFSEAKRVLVDGGIFCIGIPDASRYDDLYFFDFYWFIIREHIQHFDIEHLKLVGELEGFELVSFNKNETPIINEKTLLPNLDVIFRFTNEMSRMNISENFFELKKKTKRYITNNYEKLNNKRKIINDMVASQQPMYVWGIGREFLYLYESALLKNCNIVGLIDANLFKQNKFTVDGKKITDKSILNKATPDSALFISASAHIEQIKTILSKIGYCGRIIEV